jgi:hypothetical protein
LNGPFSGTVNAAVIILYAGSDPKLKLATGATPPAAGPVNSAICGSPPSRPREACETIRTVGVVAWRAAASLSTVASVRLWRRLGEDRLASMTVTMRVKW